MNIHQQLEVKQKAIKVIQSCKTLEQLNGAINYVRNYNDLFSDMVGYSELKRLIFKKQNLCQKN
tara:strand:- start:1949 stop:2140 length:192 start_codon:yes stop_codon:yes gene_type:complete